MNSSINHKRNILLVDDDEDDCLFISKALAFISNNIVLSYTCTVDHLFEVIDYSQPLLILIDYYMPKKNGLHLLNQIKSHSNYKDIPVVIWSTCNIPSNILEETPGMQHYFFQKPCSYEDLIIELRNVLLKYGIALK